MERRGVVYHTFREERGELPVFSIETDTRQDGKS